MSIRRLALCAAMAGICAATLLAADQAAGPAGHWDGTFSVPTPKGSQDVPFSVDLAREGQGSWTGSVDLGPRVKGLELSGITSNGPMVHFVVKNAPGDPTFDGKLAPDGNSMSSNAVFAGQTVTFKLTRSGEAKVVPPPKSTPVTKPLQGKWYTSMEAQGKMMHLVLDIESQSDGNGGGTITSVEQSSQLALTQITQNGADVSFMIRIIGGKFDGQLNPAGTELKGQWTWTQSQATVPLTFTRTEPPPAPAAPPPTTK